MRQFTNEKTIELIIKVKTGVNKPTSFDSYKNGVYFDWCDESYLVTKYLDVICISETGDDKTKGESMKNALQCEVCYLDLEAA